MVTVAGAAQSPQDANASRSSTIEVAVRTDKTEYTVGEPVRLTLVVTNRGDSTVTLPFSSGQRYDFVVLSATGDTLWRWSADMSFIQMLGEEQLEPGERLEFAEEFQETVPPGRYTVRGTLTLMTGAREAETVIHVIRGAGRGTLGAVRCALCAVRGKGEA